MCDVYGDNILHSLKFSLANDLLDGLRSHLLWSQANEAV